MSQKIFQHAKKLKRDDLMTILGGKGDEAIPPADLSRCGCSCTGSVTGPAYCAKYRSCPQVMTC